MSIDDVDSKKKKGIQGVFYGIDVSSLKAKLSQAKKRLETDMHCKKKAKKKQLMTYMYSFSNFIHASTYSHNVTLALFIVWIYSFIQYVKNATPAQTFSCMRLTSSLVQEACICTRRNCEGI